MRRPYRPESALNAAAVASEPTGGDDIVPLAALTGSGRGVADDVTT